MILKSQHSKKYLLVKLNKGHFLGFENGYIVKGYHPAEKTEGKPVKHRRSISKLIDFAMVASLLTEIAIALGGIL